MTDEVLETYPVHKFEKAEGHVLDTYATKGLYTIPIYYGDVKLDTDEEIDVNIEHIRISKKQLNQARNGDKIQGYTSNGQDFHTLRDVFYNNIMYVLFISLGIFFTLFFISFILHLYEKDAIFQPIIRLVKLIPYFRSNDVIQKSIWSVLLICCIMYAALFLPNLAHKLYPFDKEVIEAQVFGKYEEDFAMRLDKYMLEIRFVTKEDEFVSVDKEVSFWTQRKYDAGDTIHIAVPKTNPYNVFNTRLSVLDMLSTIISFRVAAVFLGLPVSMFFRKTL